MSLDAAQLEKAIREDDPARVRELLAGATEGERAACSKALKPVLKGPGYPDLDVIMLASPFQVMDLISGRRKPPEPRPEQREQQRIYDEWRELAGGLGFQLALLGLAGGARAAEEVASSIGPSRPERRWENYTDAEVGLFAAVLADRRPAWLADFVDRRLRACGEYLTGLDGWLLARHLIRLGVISRPEVPEYTTLMPEGIARGQLPGLVPGREATISRALLADPDLLADEIWRLFAVPDVGRVLEQADRWRADAGGRQTWAQALAALSAAGHVDRDRLINACIDAFSADFHPSRVAWYGAMLTELDPTIDELAGLAERYVGLLATTSKVGVTVGQAGLRQLLDAGRLDAQLLLDGSAPALLFPQKNIALAQLKLIDLVIAKMPGVAGAAIAAAAAAFGHQRQDIQEAALALIGRRGIPADAPLAEIRLRALDLSPGLQARAVEIGIAGPPVDEPEADEELAFDLSDLEQRITTLPATRQADFLTAVAQLRRGEVPGPATVTPEPGALLPPPVTDPDELVQLLTMLLEDARDAIAVERAIAAAVRLSAVLLEERRRLAGPLLKRATRLSEGHVQFIGNNVTCDIALITLAWGTGRVPFGEESRSGYSYFPGKVAVDSSGRPIFMTGIFSARAWEAAKLIEAGRGGVLLAEPETERATISHDCLRERFRQTGGVAAMLAGRHDLDAALLRLAPDAPDLLWSALSELTGIAPSALADRHRAIGQPVAFEYVSGDPAEDRHGHRTMGARVYAKAVEPVPVTADCLSWQLMTRLANPIGDYHLLTAAGRYESDYAAMIAGWPLISPWQPEVAAAHLLRPLGDGLYSKTADAVAAITALNHPGTPMGPVGHLALLTGLGSIQGDAQIAAAQWWAEACADGRLDPALAAAALGAGLRVKALMLSRVTSALRHVSHSAIAARRVVEFVCAGADELVEAKPANLGALIELAAQFAASVGRPELPAAITALADRKGSSRMVVTARQLADAGTSPAASRQQAAIEALTALTVRAGA
ncbi:MAG TPA: DUF6493 family protein [Streptosporangiaceae bacterium]|nr:DUF6493 family protein [Streptosporangiaceae bacterium]